MGFCICPTMCRWLLSVVHYLFLFDWSTRVLIFMSQGYTRSFISKIKQYFNRIICLFLAAIELYRVNYSFDVDYWEGIAWLVIVWCGWEWNSPWSCWVVKIWGLLKISFVFSWIMYEEIINYRTQIQYSYLSPMKSFKIMSISTFEGI